MAAIRTQREIRQRAPWWLFALLALNFGLMTYDARDADTKQRKIRSLAQTVMYPFQRGTSSGANFIGGFFGRFSELHRASAENEQLRKVAPSAASSAIPASAPLRRRGLRAC